MIRRNARLRKEYLFKKAQEAKDVSKVEKKKKLKQALEEGSSVPTELRHEDYKLRHEMSLEDQETEKPISSIDDEYARAGLEDPKILVTTSHDPSSRLIQFVKELKLLFPNSVRMNRGGHVVKEIVEAARANDFTDVIIVHEHRGEPDGLIVSHLPYGPTAYFALANVITRHDVKEKETMSEAYPHLIFENFSTSLGKRVQNILKYLFPVPAEDSKRVMSFVNESDFISYRHHIYQKRDEEIVLKEVGPRFELRLFQIKLGTVDMKDADNEWVLRPYMNSSKKRSFL